MGAYLSKPVTEKTSSDGQQGEVHYGASAMQGWRVSQEDAHNAILEYDAHTHLFAVYDGHGGHEVSAYTAMELPQVIKNTGAYKEGRISQALTDAFMDFDATLVQPEVVSVLTHIASSKEQAEESDDSEEDVDGLYREATMPLAEVIAKYADNPQVARCKEKKAASPYLKAKGGVNKAEEEEVEEEEAAGSSSSSSSSSTSLPSSSSMNGAKAEEEEEDVKKKEEGEKKEEEVERKVEVNGENKHIVNGGKEGEEEVEEEEKVEEAILNGETKGEEEKEEEEEDKARKGKGGKGGKGGGGGGGGGKGKSLLKNSEVIAMRERRAKEKRREAAVKAAEIYRKIQEEGGGGGEEEEEEGKMLG